MGREAGTRVRLSAGVANKIASHVIAEHQNHQVM